MSANFPSSQQSLEKQIPIMDAATTTTASSTFTYLDGTTVSLPAVEEAFPQPPLIPLEEQPLQQPLQQKSLATAAPLSGGLLPSQLSFPSAPTELASSIPTPPPAPAIYHYPHSRIRPYVKYGQLGSPLAFTIVLKQWVPLWTEDLVLPQGWIGWGAAKLSHATDSAKSMASSATGWVEDKAIHAKDATVSAATTAKDTTVGAAVATKDSIVHTGQWVEEKTVNAAVAAKDTAVHTGQWAEDKAFNAAMAAKETAVHTGEWVGDKAVRAKDTTVAAATSAKDTAVGAAHWAGEKAHVAKENAVPAAVAAAQITKEVATETGEWAGEKAHQAKEVLVPAMYTTKEKAIETGEWVGEKAHQAKENIGPAMETAREVAVEAGGFLASATHTAVAAAASAVKTGVNVASWALHKAAELEGVAVETGKAVLGRVEEMLPKPMFYTYNPEWEEGMIPVPPPAPAVYRYPAARVRPYVKYGRNMQKVAFTIVLKTVILRVKSWDSAFEKQHGGLWHQQESSFGRFERATTTPSAPTLSVTETTMKTFETSRFSETASTTDSTALKGGVSTHSTNPEKDRLPSFISPH